MKMCNEMMADMGMNDMMDKGMGMMKKGMSLMGGDDKTESTDTSSKKPQTESSEVTADCKK